MKMPDIEVVSQNPEVILGQAEALRKIGYRMVKIISYQRGQLLEYSATFHRDNFLRFIIGPISRRI